jgi:hypothetical protein
VKRAVLLTAGFLLAGSAAGAQAVRRSHSSGFFLGIGFEGNAVSTQTSQGKIDESGSGGGLILGYGFTDRWSLVGNVSRATINVDGGYGGTYPLTHVDLGARVHFRTGPNVVVPFVQFGFSGLAEEQTFPNGAGGSTKVKSSGGGFNVEAGMNAHFNPRFATSVAVTFTGGTFQDFTFNGVTQDAAPIDVSSARLHIGMIWFPGG